MDYEIKQLPVMMVAGMDVYTSNSAELSGQGNIPALWKRFFSENIANRIADKTDEFRIVAGYTDIETDETGPYRFFIGVQVSGFENIPDNFYKIEIPEARYAECLTDSGPFATVGIHCWQRIWSDPDLKKKRSYEIDLEIYDPNNMDPDNIQFSIYVGIKQ